MLVASLRLTTWCCAHAARSAHSVWDGLETLRDRVVDFKRRHAGLATSTMKTDMNVHMIRCAVVSKVQLSGVHILYRPRATHHLDHGHHLLEQLTRRCMEVLC